MPQIPYVVKAIKPGTNGSVLVALEAQSDDDLEVGDVLSIIRATPCPLTERQLECLRGLAEGQTYKEIAAERERAVSTVRSQIFGVYRRLNVLDRAQAVLLAKEEGWIR